MDFGTWFFIITLLLVFTVFIIVGYAKDIIFALFGLIPKAVARGKIKWKKEVDKEIEKIETAKEDD